MIETNVLVDDATWERVAPLLPPESPRPQGGRPRLGDRVALNGILLVLKSGIPWERLPQDLGYGSGMTCWRRLRLWQRMEIWPAMRQVLVEHLNCASQIDWDRADSESTHASIPDESHAPRRTRRARGQ